MYHLKSLDTLNEGQSWIISQDSHGDLVLGEKGDFRTVWQMWHLLNTVPPIQLYARENQPKYHTDLSLIYITLLSP